ncbi:WEB family protein At1g75720 [Eutrema salsugineum]|uniref:WEB family protein At1g75720 n=1 Tax=Eutrema salsugineum TaxID=72664 RepID=UPI000CED06B3|nr:WEB family protein At1g75720 [Eutrema salsugineum]
MEMERMEEHNQAEQHHVDTSRPFSSVKEAVEIFGQRIMLPVQTQTVNHKPTSPKISHTASLPSSPWRNRSSLPSSPQTQGSKEEFMDVLKKLEAEITETKTEVKMLKERETETEVALANLNAELHKNMSKMAKAEADAAGKSASAMAKSVSFKETNEKENGEEERRKELMRRMQKEYPSLAQILESNKGDRNGYFAKNTKKTKKKPIIPLVGDFFFFKKKRSSTEISAPLSTTSSTLRF